jgi:hypothetical protein
MLPRLLLYNHLAVTRKILKQLVEQEALIVKKKTMMIPELGKEAKEYNVRNNEQNVNKDII